MYITGDSIFYFPRVLLEEYCSVRQTLSENKSEISRLNEKVIDLVQALEKRLVVLFQVLNLYLWCYNSLKVL